MISSALLFCCAGLLVFATGCGAGTEATASNIAPTISLTAGPASVAAGAASTLTIAAANATSVTLTGSDGSSFNMPATGGSKSVSPSATTTYTATATGPGGTASAQATVTVTALAIPTVTLSASPASIAAGGSSTLVVAATNATGVSIAGSDGTTYTLGATGGSQVVTPQATATYTATVTGAGGTVSAQTTVTVVATPPPAAPTITVSANPSSISAGTSSTLTVAATNGSSIAISGSDGTTSTLPAAGGTVTVTPTVTTTYTATVTGPGGKASAQTTVTVTPNPAPSLTIAATPSSVTVSNSSLLVVTVLNAAQVTITGSDGTKYSLPASGGNQAVSPTKTTTYTATAVGPGGTTSASTTVTVTPNPAPSISMTASPTSIVAGNSSVLTFDATNATTVTIKGSDGSSYTPLSTSATQSVTPAATTTYTATATGPGGTTSAMATVTVTPVPMPTASISANPATITSGNTSTLTFTATNATSVTISGSDGESYSGLPVTGGTQVVTPTATTSYTLTVTGQNGQQATANTTVIIAGTGTVKDIDHVIFMLQENHSFDNYFGMLNPYRQANGYSVGADGVNYAVDGIDDKLTGPQQISLQDDEGDIFHPFPLASTCVDDMSSAWLESYGDVNRYDFSTTRSINMDGFVHTAEGFAKSCLSNNNCSGSYTDTTGQRAMGYYDQNTLNYYYNMASQFALSDRWFTPVSSKSIDNRIATFTGGTTQGLTADPGNNDGLSQLAIPTIFQELQTAGVSWKIYYTVTQGECDDDDDCPTTANARFPGTNFTALQDSYKYLYIPSTPGQCNAPAQSSNNPVTGDTTGSFCVDPTHIAPVSQYFVDVANGTLPAFAFIEAGYGHNDEHPGSGQSVLQGQMEVSKIVNALMTSDASWKDSVFFLAYDEAGGPYDHVPPVPGHSNDFTDASVGAAAKGTIPDISSIAVNADSYKPCLPPAPGTPTLHCDLQPNSPGANATDAPAQQGFAAQLGFRVPNMVISPFTKAHYVSHIPMDHTAILKFVENRFIQGSAHLTARDAAQPDLLDFFDFKNRPRETPPTPPSPITDSSGSTCHASSLTTP